MKKVVTIPMIVGVLGTVSRSLGRHMDQTEVTISIEHLQKTIIITEVVINMGNSLIKGTLRKRD